MEVQSILPGGKLGHFLVKESFCKTVEWWKLVLIYLCVPSITLFVVLDQMILIHGEAL